jgi:hypothetical protein
VIDRPRPRPDNPTRRLQALEARVAQLEALVLPLDDHVWLAMLAEATQGAIFSVHELRQHAVVVPVLRQALGRFTAKQLGKTLHRIADGRPRGAFTLERLTRERGGWVWRVVPADPR